VSTSFNAQNSWRIPDHVDIKKLFLITLLVKIPHLALATTWEIDPVHTTV